MKTLSDNDNKQTALLDTFYSREANALLFGYEQNGDKRPITGKARQL